MPDEPLGWSFAWQRGFCRWLSIGLVVMGVRNPTACYRELGAELVRIRKAARISGEVVAHRTGWTRTKVARIECGQLDSSVTDVVHYIVVCGVRLPDAAEVLELARLAERKQGYWLSGVPGAESLRSLIFHEAAADCSIDYEPLVVPGLLQTPKYSRQQMVCGPGTTEAAVDAAVRTRLERQRILRGAEPGRFTFFVHEQALRLQVGDPALMVEQLLHLVLVAALDHVMVRVVPSSAGARSVFGGPFKLLEHAKHHALAYLDLPRSGLFLEGSQVDDYRKLVPDLSKIALDGAPSRRFIAALADEYDRLSHRGVAHHLQQESSPRPGPHTTRRYAVTVEPPLTAIYE